MFPFKEHRQVIPLLLVMLFKWGVGVDPLRAAKFKKKFLELTIAAVGRLTEIQCPPDHSPEDPLPLGEAQETVNELMNVLFQIVCHKKQPGENQTDATKDSNRGQNSLTATKSTQTLTKGSNTYPPYSVASSTTNKEHNVQDDGNKRREGINQFRQEVGIDEEDFRLEEEELPDKINIECDGLYIPVGKEEREEYLENLSELLKIDRTNMNQLLRICEVRQIPPTFLTYKPPSQFYLTLPYAEWGKACDGKLMKKGWGQIIDDALHRMDFPCSFNAKNATPYTSEKTKKTSFTISGHCGGKCGTEFKISVKPYEMLQPVSLKVRIINGDSFSILQSESTGRQLRGPERERYKKRLTHEKPYKVFVDTMNRTLSLRFLHYNFCVRSVAVLNKARSENRRRNVITGYLTEDIAKLSDRLQKSAMYSSSTKTVDPGYIRQNSHMPFLCSFYSPRQIRYSLLTDLWFLDATGSIVHNVDGKQTMLHSIIGKMTEEPEVPGVPICEFLLNRNGGVDILPILVSFIKCLRDVDATYSPKLVCTDFSFPYLHSLAKAWNDQSLMDHVNESFRALTDKTIVPEHWVHLVICKLHILNGFGRNLNLHHVDDVIRQLALHGMAKIQEASSLEDFNIAVTHFITLFGTPEIPGEQIPILVYEMEHSSLPPELTENLKEFLDSLTPEIETNVVRASSEFRNQREKSLAYQQFLKEEKSILAHTYDANVVLKENTFYCPQVINTMRDVYFPYVALWTAATPRHHVPEALSPVHLLSTAPVENYFGKHKDNLHPEPRQEVTGYIEEHGKLVQGMISNSLSVAKVKIIGHSKPNDPPKPSTEPEKTEVNSNSTPTQSSPPPTPPRNQCNTEANSKRKIEDDVEFHKCQEVWGKKNKKSRTLYHNRNQRASDNRSHPTKANTGTDSVQENMEKLMKKIKLNLNRARKRTTVAHSESPVEPAENEVLNSTITIDEEEDDYEELYRVPATIPLPLLFQSSTLKGGEDDLATLAGTAWVNDTVIQGATEILREMYIASTPGLLQFPIINTNTIRREPRNRDGVVDFVWAENPQGLPKAGVIDIHSSELLYPANLSGHWWLCRISFEGRVIRDYDTKKKSLPLALKKEFYERLKGLLKIKYGIPKNQWKLKKEIMGQQDGGHECGPLTLAAVEAIFLGLDPTDTVNPLAEKDYRRKHALLLLKTGVNGKILLEAFPWLGEEASTDHILALIGERKKARSLKTQIGLGFERLHESIGSAANQIRSEVKSLMEELDTFCDTTRITGNSPFLIHSWDIAQSSVRRIGMEQLDQILGEVGTDLQKIALKKKPSSRYEMFLDEEVEGLEGIQCHPDVFSDEQVGLIEAYLKGLLGIRMENEGERLMSQLVLIPETQIRVYAYFKRTSVGMAEQELGMDLD